ncbi:hypothetical protein J437_LFUL013944, partial [Ladona fulva]
MAPPSARLCFQVFQRGVPARLLHAVARRQLPHICHGIHVQRDIPGSDVRDAAVSDRCLLRPHRQSALGQQIHRRDDPATGRGHHQKEEGKRLLFEINPFCSSASPQPRIRCQSGEDAGVGGERVRDLLAAVPRLLPVRVPSQASRRFSPCAARVLGLLLARDGQRSTQSPHLLLHERQ